MKYIFLFIVLVLIGCTTGNVVKESFIREDVQEPNVYFCPNDKCEDLLVWYIENSKQSIHCALFDLDLENVLKAFSEKSKEIDVKIVVDDNNWDNDFGGKGIIKDSSSQLSHNKFCVFDNYIVWTGSFNPTNNGAYKNNNNVIVIGSKHLANNHELEFNELWNYNFGKGHSTIEPTVYLNGKKYSSFFCPEDNCKDIVINELDKAQESIYFMVFSFTDFDISNKLASKEHLDVRGIMESRRVNMQYNQYNNLVSKSVVVKKDTNPAVMHHKVFIIDNRTLITGSYNPTKAANTKNDENILVINDKKVVDKYLEEFDSLFNS